MAVELPDWVQWVAGGLGLTIAAVAARLGWTGKPQTPAAEIAGAIVDNKSAKEISDAIHVAMLKYLDVHEESIALRREEMALQRMEIESRVKLAGEIDTLHQEVRQLAREIITAASRRT